MHARARMALGGSAGGAGRGREGQSLCACALQNASTCTVVELNRFMDFEMEENGLDRSGVEWNGMEWSGVEPYRPTDMEKFIPLPSWKIGKFEKEKKY